MLKPFARDIRVSFRSLCVSLSAFLIVAASPLYAQDKPVTIGAGMRTSFAHTDPDGLDSADQFFLNSARLYVNGTVVENIKFMFNTEYDGVSNKVGVLDAAARLEFKPTFNIWAGRFLPPSDRANLYGPYYAHHWDVFNDGIQNGHPFVFQGRDNGVVYWGDFKKIKISGGAFDGASLNGKTDLLGAGRVQVDLWDAEPGYYQNGTYYGEKNLLAIGVASQVQNGNTANTADFLLEKKFGSGGVMSIESEYAYYNELGGYDSNYNRSQGAYVLGSFLFPQQVGIGKFEILGKYGESKFTRGKTVANPVYVWKTTEVDFSYIIKEFNARVMFFYKNNNFTAVKTDTWQSGVGLQIQM